MPATPSVLQTLDSLHGSSSAELTRLAWSALLRAPSAEDRAVGLDYAIDKSLIDGYFAPHFRGEAVTEPADRFWVHPDNGLEMVWIPAGNYPVGPREAPRSFEHRGFFLSRYPVTKLQFAAFMDSWDYLPKAENGYGAFLNDFSKENTPPAEKADHPVVWVSWDDAAAYCAAHCCCLPSEWEWEAAARGLEGWPCPWSEHRPEHFDWQPGKGMKMTPMCHWRGRTTCRVDAFSLARTPFGCEQLVGNVSEWCRPAASPWEELADLSEELRPVRGACFRRRVLSCLLSSHRRNLHHRRRNDWTGFRPALRVHDWMEVDE